MDPDQTEQSDLGPYCVQYRLSKNISRPESRRQVETGGKSAKVYQTGGELEQGESLPT